ncbi:hypothetical protein ScPMuIL_003285 [Solemya velum]
MAEAKVDGSGSGKKEECDTDKELNELLDIELPDFRPHSIEYSTIRHSRGTPDKAEKEPATDPDRMAEEFSEQIAQQMEQAMQMFMKEDPSLMAHVEKLAKAASDMGENAESQQDFSATLAQTMAGLSQNTTQLQDNISEEDLSKAFSSMGLENEEGVEPMMQDMMKTLLSKEVLYPSLKEMNDKYPKWLKTNESKVEKSKLENYKKQHSLIKSICTEFEAEKASDSDSMKNTRFQNILDLMQKMQELGQPPEEIVAEMAPGLKFNESGLPNIPGSQEGCSIM